MLKLLLAVFAVGASCHATETVNRNQGWGSMNQYHVYTRENSHDHFPLTANTIGTSPMTLERDTVIIIHGHQATGFTSLNPTVKNAYLDSGDYNIIVVDWSVPAGLGYNNAVAAAQSVGNNIADMINLLVGFTRVELERLHIVGHGLGAHVAGFTGRALNGQVARITGLDPAKSQWGTSSPRLSFTDARYVEVIHTDSDGLFATGLGTAIGHVDFFPNGGGNQPGCLFHACSHDRSWMFFSASLIFNHLIGNHCSSSLQIATNLCRGPTLHMGNNNYIKYGVGTYRVNTKRTFPF